MIYLLQRSESMMMRLVMEDCEFVVMDRDEVLFRARVKGGEAAKLIKVDITGRSRVSLRVDPGKDLDIADHADWADACFLQRLK